jgi:hypothetical protein
MASTRSVRVSVTDTDAACACMYKVSPVDVSAQSVESLYDVRMVPPGSSVGRRCTPLRERLSRRARKHNN